MKSCCFLIVLALLAVTVSTRAKDSDAPSSIDPFHFLAGVGAGGVALRAADSSACELFYKEDGERRLAELFVELTEAWHQQEKTPVSMERFFQRSGKRFVVKDAALGAALRAFYGGTIDGQSPSVHTIEFDEEKRLSFAAGIYARCFHEGAFYGPPTPAMRATVFILLAEGCEVSNLIFRQNEVPNVMTFKVKPSERVARLFALVDNWRSTPLQWTEK